MIKRKLIINIIKKFFSFIISLKFIGIGFFLSFLVDIILDIFCSQYFPNIVKDVIGKIEYLIVFLCFCLSFNIFKRFIKVNSFLTASYSFLLFLVFYLFLFRTKIPDAISQDLVSFIYLLFLEVIFIFLLFFISFVFKFILWLEKKISMISSKKIITGKISIISKIIKKILLVLAKILRLIFLFIVFLVIILNKNIPAFIYNELEWKARNDYLAAEDVKDYINTLINVRTGNSGLLVSDNQLFRLPENLKTSLKDREFLINDYFKQLHKQDKIPFLPKKYKEYHLLKTESIINYKKGFESFKAAFENQEKILKLSDKIDDLNSMLFNGLKQSLIPNPNVVLAKNLLEENNQLYKDGVIDTDTKVFFDFKNQQIIDVYEFLLNLNGRYPTKEETSKLITILLKKPDLPDYNTIIQNLQKNIFEPKKKQMDDYHKLAFDQIIKADEYYKGNNLKNDLISLILSKFSKKYPKNI